ncbi:hypothetical protein [Oceanibaculum indicum]|uniref:Uncharacterized protein n=1 Tax=Oceanibaculum indicum TaxID=526216 RepID=A0A420WGN3_9PROT|nr:hypothetical protein [Oceanibaculum indicum]RKQ70122.1 hypothetical protein BCL74_2062 [Oceanibaculum indicum]
MMNNPGIFSLGDFQIGAAAIGTGDVVAGLDGMQAMTLSARLAYGSGGSTVVAVVQTSLNQGVSWIDIARLDFTTSGAEKVVNLTTGTPKTTPYTSAALSAEGAVDGILGDRVRAVVTSTGTYAGSTVLSVRINAS